MKKGRYPEDGVDKILMNWILGGKRGARLCSFTTGVCLFWDRENLVRKEFGWWSVYDREQKPV